MPYTAEGVYYADTSSSASIADNSLALADSVSSIFAGAVFYSDIKYYFSSGTFVKADYPGLKALRIKCLGGGSGGAAAGVTASAQAGIAAGGVGGWYAESFIKDVDSLPDVVTVTVGAGGAGGVPSVSVPQVGGNSSFGSEVIASGGRVYNSFLLVSVFPGLRDINIIDPIVPGSSKGDLLIAPGGPTQGLAFSATAVIESAGGDNFMWKRRLATRFVSTTGVNGQTNSATKGVGGSGGFNPQSQVARSGGAGTEGIVIVEVYQ